jgi:hypothetical protein
MKTYTMTLLAGIAIGATALQGLHRAAQRQIQRAKSIGSFFEERTSS